MSLNLKVNLIWHICRLIQPHYLEIACRSCTIGSKSLEAAVAQEIIQSVQFAAGRGILTGRLLGFITSIVQFYRCSIIVKVMRKASTSRVDKSDMAMNVWVLSKQT